jgi:hypothetical protein
MREYEYLGIENEVYEVREAWENERVYALVLGRF